MKVKTPKEKNAHELFTLHVSSLLLQWCIQETEKEKQKERVSCLTKEKHTPSIAPLALCSALYVCTEKERKERKEKERGNKARKTPSLPSAPRDYCSDTVSHAFCERVNKKESAKNQNRPLSKNS